MDCFLVNNFFDNIFISIHNFFIGCRRLLIKPNLITFLFRDFLDQPLAPYSLIVLPYFNEEEDINRLEEDEAIDDVGAQSNKVAQLANKVSQRATEGTGEDAALELSPKP